MRSSFTPRSSGFKPLVPWAAAMTLGLGFAVGSSSALAAAPPANTIIGNQASAAYNDPNGQAQTATSNLVQTTVQQVGSFNLDGFTTVTTTVYNTKTAAAGATVFAPHVLTNTGNGADGFNITVDVPGPSASPGPFQRVAVYADANFDGLPDNPSAHLCEVTTATGTCTVPTQTVAGNNGQFGFVVAYTLPASATTPTTPYSSSTVTATAVTTGLYTSANAADVDHVNLTTQAAFNLSKAISVPASGIAAPGTGSWPSAIGSGQRSLSTCSATLASAQAPAAGCVYTVYTLTYNNTGGNTGRFALQDVIGTGATSGMTYIPGSAVWSNAGGVALDEAAGGDPAGTDFQVSGNTLTFVDNALPVNTTRSISFMVLVNSTAAVGTSTTSNQANYNPVDATGATAGSPGTLGSLSNISPFTVLGTYSIVLGSTTSTAVTGLDAIPGTPNGTAADLTSVAGAAAGTAVPFTQVVYNTGNATDVVNLAAASTGTAGGTAFPAGTTYQFFRADGSTPLTDTNGDSIVDTGPIAAGSSVSIVVKAVLPATVAAQAGPFTLTVTGTSTSDASKLDATADQLAAITGVLVDLTNTAIGTSGASGDLGTGPSAAPTTTNTVAAGATTAFTLFVTNGDSTTNSYTLAAGSNAAMAALPAGWTVKFVSGNVAAASCASASAISSTPSLTTGAQATVTACVTVPSTQTAVTAAPLYFQVRSVSPASTGSAVVDTKYDAVTVTAASLTYATTLTPNNSGQVAPTGSVVYAHTLTNTGTASCTGSYTVGVTLPPADVAAGWTAVLYDDVNGDGVLDNGDTVSSGTYTDLNVGATRKFLVKVYSNGALPGSVDVATVTATFTGTPACGTPNATDTSTVITGQIRLQKTQVLDVNCDGAETPVSADPITAKPGECIIYRVVATNEGAAPVSNLSIVDAIPTYTTHQAGATDVCSSTNVSGTPLAFSVGAGSVSCGSTSNTVQPGGTATLGFEVKINQ